MFWIYLFLITLFIRPQDWPGSPVFMFPVNYVIMLGGIFTGFLNMMRGNRTFKTKHTLLILVFVGLGFISNAGNGDVSAGVTQAIVLFKRFLVYAMFLMIVDSPKKIKQVLFFSSLLAVVLSFQGMYQAAHGVGWAMQRFHTSSELFQQNLMYGFQEYGVRIFWLGVWDGPNVLALVFLFGIPFCLDSFFDRKKMFIARFIFLACFIFLSYGIYLTNSRGGFLAYAGMLAVYSLLRFEKKYWPVILAVFILPAMIVFAPARMRIMNTEESSASERTWLWEQGLNMLRENPVFGIGKGRFGQYAQLIAHSNYVGNMAEAGLPGLLVLMTLVYLSLKGAYITYKNADRNSELSRQSRIVLTTAIGFYLATVFVVMELEILYMIWALCASVFLQAKWSDYRIKLDFKLKDLVTVALASGMFLIFIWLVAEKEVF
jgi:O-antigen ligase